MSHDQFTDASAYEKMMGRWSRRLSKPFLAWLAPEPGLNWADVGCGTGALSAAILEYANPRSIAGFDPAAAYIRAANDAIQNPLAHFEVGDAEQIPLPNDAVDLTVSGLVLNFVSDPQNAVAEMTRTTRSGGRIAATVWDYGEGMRMHRTFWDAATSLFPDAAREDPGNRFILCKPQPLIDLFRGVCLQQVETTSLSVEMDFANFEDYWQPFEGGQGSSGGYARTLTEADRDALRDAVRNDLPIDSDGSIHLISRAWAVRGTVA